jgi:hypothetical protein
MVIAPLGSILLAAASFAVPHDAMKEPLVSKEFSANPTEFQRVAIAPIVFMHYGYSRMVVYTNEEAAVPVRELSDKICSNVTAGLMKHLTAKNYRIAGTLKTLVTKSDWNLLDPGAKAAFEPAHKEFGEVSRLLHDRARRAEAGSTEPRMVNSVSELGTSDASAVLFVDERSTLLPSAVRDRKTRVTTWSAYTEAIEFNVGLVDIKSGNLLWWHTGKFVVDNGREAEQVQDCIGMLLWGLPAISEPNKK